MNETITQKSSLDLVNWPGFITQVYGLMTLGLFLTAATAVSINVLIALVMQSRSEMGVLVLNILLNPIVLFIAFFAQLGIVVALSAGLQRMNTTVATALFVFYALLLGYTLSGILLVYTTASVFGAFVVTAATFLIMSVIGYLTKIDLTRVGGLAIGALIGLIVASIVNIFLRSSGLELFLNYLGVFIFLILIAYDTQKLKNLAASADTTGFSKYAVIGALTLYMDFVNLFLFILRLTGKRR